MLSASVAARSGSISSFFQSEIWLCVPAGWKPFAVETEIADHVAGEAGGVGLIVDRERAWVAERFTVASKDPDAGRVKGGDPHRPHDRPDQRTDPLAHLGGRLVGEGDREDARGPNASVEQVRNSVGEHPRLSRPRTGDHQQRPGGMHDGIELVGIQAFGERVRADLADPVDVDLVRPIEITGGVDRRVGWMWNRIVGERLVEWLVDRPIREQVGLVRHRPTILRMGCHATGVRGAADGRCVEPRNGPGTNSQQYGASTNPSEPSA